MEPKDRDETRQRITRLSPEQRALLERRLLERREGVPAPSNIPRRPAGDPPPSFAQQRLWFLDQFEPGSHAYNMASGMRLMGDLEPEVVRRALGAIVARHEVLRTTHEALDGIPVQVISERQGVDVPLTDLSGWPAADRDAELRRCLTEGACRPFDLSRDPVLRASLFRLSAGDHVLLLVLHHIAADAWSLGVLFREFSACYTAFAQGRHPALPPLPIQYADYAVWQRARFQGLALEPQLRYWRRVLDGVPGVLELPTDHLRPQALSGRGARVMRLLPADLPPALRSLARQEGATLFAALLASFHALLYRYTGQDDIVVGSPVAGRTRVEVEGLIGLFLNALCLRADLSGNPTFRQILRRVREATLGALSHQDLPFEKLVEDLHLERRLSHTPVFQVFFNLVIEEGLWPVLPGIRVTPLVLETETTKYDLMLAVAETTEGLRAALRYSTDLFTADTAERMMGHWLTLLEAIVAHPDSAVADLPLLTADERRARAIQLQRVRARRAQGSFPRVAIEQSLPARFEQQVRERPQAVAVRGRRQAWTFGELNGAANRLAHALLEDCGPGEGRVALLFGHDAPMVAGILGALKAGKSYVPLDPRHPRERLAGIVADAGATAVMADPAHAALARALSGEGVPVVVASDPGAETPADDPGLVISPDALAYLLYTSGSTGRPKGVMQSHRNVLHHIQAYTSNLGIGPGDRLTLFASYGFDAAVMDIFGALLNGASLCPWDLRGDGLAGIARWLKEERITIFHATPTLFRHFLDALAPDERFPTVRMVVLGGEEVVRTDVELFRRHFAPPCLFVNGLGPTESTLALQHFVDHETLLVRTRVPIGDPVEETEVLLLDDKRRPAGVSGELAIRSPYVALGYWGQPEATRLAFRPDPEGGTRRIFLTGDLGRRLPNGSLEFMGRKDFQIKIRGIRVEPAEIEEVLERCEGVQEAVVVARDDAPGGLRLVAYVVTSRGASASPGTWRRFLQERLPDYMVPAAFVTLEALPLTATGKVDRRALPAPDTTRAAASLTAPRDLLEIQLVQLWERVLGIRPVGVRDNFFELGGHSLLAVRLFDAIAKQTDRHLPLATLFQAPTVEALANVLRQEGWMPPWEALVPIQAAGRRLPLFCVHQHTGHLFCYHALTQHLGPDQPMFGLSARGVDGQAPPRVRIEEMAAAYLKEIRQIQPEGPYHLAGYCFGGALAYEMAQQLVAEGHEVGVLALIETARGRVDLGDGGRVERWAERVAFEWGKLAELSASAKMRVVTRTAAEDIVYRVRRANDKARQVVDRTLRRETYVDRAVRTVRAAHVEAVRHYRPRPYPGRVHLFRRARLPFRFRKDPTLGWGALIGDLHVIEIPCDRPTIVEEPPVEILAEWLDRLLRDSQHPLIARV